MRRRRGEKEEGEGYLELKFGGQNGGLLDITHINCDEGEQQSERKKEKKGAGVRKGGKKEKETEKEKERKKRKK